MPNKFIFGHFRNPLEREREREIAPRQVEAPSQPSVNYTKFFIVWTASPILKGFPTLLNQKMLILVTQIKTVYTVCLSI